VEQARVLAQASEYLIGLSLILDLLAEIAEAEGNHAEANHYRVEAQYVQAELQKRR